MSTTSYFDAAALLLFQCAIEHKSIHRIWLALDTGASTTMVSPEVLQKIGFQPEEMQTLATFGDASRDHIVPQMSIPSFRIGDVTVKELEALSYALPEAHDIDGVLGRNFLRHFKRFTVDFKQSVLVLEKQNELPS